VADDMALSLIAEVMDWDDARATSEYGWLRMMSSIKYDGYSDFRAGVRFVESLAVWLKQFTPPDRPTAYDFFKARVVYVSPAELQCLIDIFFPEVVTRHCGPRSPPSWRSNHMRCGRHRRAPIASKACCGAHCSWA
jgi:hypothetical protein